MKPICSGRSDRGIESCRQNHRRMEATKSGSCRNADGAITRNDLKSCRLRVGDSSVSCRIKLRWGVLFGSEAGVAWLSERRAYLCYRLLQSNVTGRVRLRFALWGRAAHAIACPENDPQAIAMAHSICAPLLSLLDCRAALRGCASRLSSPVTPGLLPSCCLAVCYIFF